VPQRKSILCGHLLSALNYAWILHRIFRKFPSDSASFYTKFSAIIVAFCTPVSGRYSLTSDLVPQYSRAQHRWTPITRWLVLYIEFHSHFSITHLGLSFLCRPLHLALFVLAVVWFIDMFPGPLGKWPARTRFGFFISPSNFPNNLFNGSVKN